MPLIKVPVVLLLTLIYCNVVFGHGQKIGGFGDQGIDNQRYVRGFSGRFGEVNSGSPAFVGKSAGGRSFGGQNGGQDGNSGKYRANLYFDDDVYGYDASYPGGEALYINYKSNNAKARRAQEFSRNSPYSSSQGSQGFSRSESPSGRFSDQGQGRRNHRSADFGPQW